MVRLHVGLAMGFLGLSIAASAQTIALPYANDYTLVRLGPYPALPSGLGGILLDPTDPNRLLVGVRSVTDQGAIFRVQLRRDAGGRILGFQGNPTQRAVAHRIDGGLCVAPGNVLLYASYPSNELSQVTPASTGPIKSHRMSLVGISESIGALRFVPLGLPASGRLKLTSYTTGRWYDIALAPDSAGTYNVVGAQEFPASTLDGGTGSVVYMDPGLPQFHEPTLLATEFDFRSVSAFQVDAFANPIPGTRQPVVEGLLGVQGAAIDTLSGDVILSSMVTNEFYLLKRTSPGPKIAGAVSFERNAGPLAGRTVEISLQRPDGTALETRNVTLGPYGHFAFYSNRTGDYILAIKGSNTLRHKRPVRFGTGTLVHQGFALVPGDITGDNAIGVADFLALRQAMGSRPGQPNWNPRADLDGDGAVGVSDFLILRANMGRQGD